MKKSSLIKSKEPLHLVGVKRLHLRGVKQAVIILGIILFLSPSYSADFTITLKNGKNLISIPLIPQNDQIPSVLQSITGLYTDVWGFEPLDTVDPWKHYRPDLTEYSDLARIKHGMGYYLFATGDSSLTITGTRPTANYTFTLNKGWNVIGWPYLYEEDIESALTNDASPDLQFGIDYNQISRINPVTKEQEDYYNNPSIDVFNTFTPGKAYYIYFLGQNPIQVTILLIPQVKITSHADNSYVNTPLIDISGTIDDDTTLVEVNGIAAAVMNKKFKAINVPLHVGLNTITVTAANLAGNSSSDSITLYLDSQAPVIHITSPSNGAVINAAPITVTGTVDDPNAYIDVNGVFADITAGTFQAQGVDLKLGANTITATAYDRAGNSSTDAITVTSTVTSLYELIKLTEDIYPGSPQAPIAGSQIELKAKLVVEDSPKPNEPIQFTITGGSGSLSQQVINTDVNGIATNTLTLDVNSGAINQIEAYAVNYPAKKITFSVATTPDTPNQLIKLVDESINPVPGTIMPIIVKLVDHNGNPTPGENIQFTIVSGGGNLSASTSTTTGLGVATTYFTAPSGYGQTSQIRAQLTRIPTISTVITIVTSQTLSVTIDQIMAKVQANDALIQDVKADIHVTSNAPWMAIESYLKIWIKGRKQKVQELSPNPGVYTRPIIDGNVTLDKEILSYEPTTNIYTIKLKKTGQTGIYPYIIHYIDYNKGVITKTEYHILQDGFETTSVSEYSNFIQINGAWGYQAQADKVYGEDNQLLYTTTNTYSNIGINTGIADSEFE